MNDLSESRRAATLVGEVVALWRFPVKSMRGEKLDTARVGAEGLDRDRELVLVDDETGAIVVGKTPKLGPRLLTCQAVAGAFGDDVCITLGDGTEISSADADVDRRLSDYFDHPVRLRRGGFAESRVDKVRTTFSELTGIPLAVPETSLLDLMPVSVLTTATLDRLAASAPQTQFDERRFRMNVIVEATTTGFPENEWLGAVLSIGDVRLRLALPVPRCVLTTYAQDDLPEDSAVLRTVARENSLEIAGKSYPCAGAYATVEHGGTIERGAAVTLVHDGTGLPEPGGRR